MIPRRAPTSFVAKAFSSGGLGLLLALFLPALLLGSNEHPETASCSLEPNGCEKGQVKATSLLQLNSPVRFGQSAESLIGGEPAFEALHGNLVDTLLLEGEKQPDVSDTQGLQLVQSGNAATKLSTEVAKFMQGAAEDAKSAQDRAASEAARAAQTVQALEELRRSSQEARAAQDAESRKADEVGKALVGAMQRVQRASEVEVQEVAMEAEATRRLRDAAKSAKQVQLLEDEGAAREARAAELLEEAIHKLSLANPTMEDAGNPMRETLKVVEEAQKVVAAEASGKARASELLQESLQGAATAVEALKAGKEAQTSKWLQDAFRELQWMHASWRQRTDAETKVAESLDGAVKSSETAEKLADESSASKQSVLALLEECVQKVRAAQNMASRQASTDQLAKEAAAARETLKDRSLQEALLKLQAFEQAHNLATPALFQGVQGVPMQDNKVSQLSNYLQGLMQNVKAASDAQQVQLAQVMQQVGQAMNTQPAIPSAPIVPGAAQFFQQPQSAPPVLPMNNFYR